MQLAGRGCGAGVEVSHVAVPDAERSSPPMGERGHAKPRALWWDGVYKIFHRPDEHPEPHSLLKDGVLARSKTACRHSYQGMNFGAYTTLDLGTALNRKGGKRTRGGHGGYMCVGNERNTGMDEAVSVPRAEVPQDRLGYARAR